MADRRLPAQVPSVYATPHHQDLRFALESEGECLVFDRLTNDLFVVPQLGRAVLETLQRGGPMDARMLLDELAGRDSDVSADADADAEAEAERVAKIEGVLREFESYGLIEPFRVDCCGPDAP